MDTRSPSAFLLPKVIATSLCCLQFAYSGPIPCNLLTQNQVSTILEASVGSGSPIADTGCSWRAGGASKAMVTVSLQSEKMFNGAKASSAPTSTKTPVSGVGDEAIFIGAEGFSSLWVRKGTTYLLIRAYGLPVKDAQTKLKALAANAISKL